MTRVLLAVRTGPCFQKAIAFRRGDGLTKSPLEGKRIMDWNWDEKTAEEGKSKYTLDDAELGRPPTTAEAQEIRDGLAKYKPVTCFAERTNSCRCECACRRANESYRRDYCLVTSFNDWKRWLKDCEADAADEKHFLANLEALRSSPWLAACPDGLGDIILARCVAVTRDRAERLANTVAYEHRYGVECWDSVYHIAWSLENPAEVEASAEVEYMPSDNTAAGRSDSQVIPFPRVQDFSGIDTLRPGPLRQWLDDEQMQTKYEGDFRRYLRFEHDLP
jgi:hypothetical protein